MADWTEEEYKKMLGYRPKNESSFKGKKMVAPFEKYTYPESLDWTT